jgi:hypothetical protein
MVIVDALDEAAAGFYAAMASRGCRNRCVSLCRCVRLVWELNDDAFAFTASR